MGGAREPGRLATPLTARGRLERPHARRLVALEPTHEEAHRALIRLDGWLGRVERPRLLTLLAQARKDLEAAGAPAGRPRASWEAWVKARRLEASPELQAPR